MTDTETKILIPASLFLISKIDGTTKEQIIKNYPTRNCGAYYLDKFSNYLKDNYKISLKDYCIQYLNWLWPVCPISNIHVGYKIKGSGILLSKFKKGSLSKATCPNFAAACEKLSKDRIGNKNPMYGRKPWNLGKDKRNPIIKKLSQKRLGTKTSDATKNKQSISAKKRLIHGHTGRKHSLSTIKQLRLNTSALWASGRFNQISSIHLKVREFLNTLLLSEGFKEEFQVKYFSMDFAFPFAKVAIECQGTYFHVDPRIYPNGPKDAIQRRNFGRDENKKKICEQSEGWIIIELWETEINDGSFKHELLCKLLKLNLLSH